MEVFVAAIGAPLSPAESRFYLCRTYTAIPRRLGEMPSKSWLLVVVVSEMVKDSCLVTGMPQDPLHVVSVLRVN